MKYSLALVAGLGLAAASHAGHERFHRRAEVDTVTDWTVVTVTDVVTVYGPSPVAQQTPPAQSPNHPASSPVKPTSAAPQTTPAETPVKSPVQQSPPAQSPQTTLVTSQVPKPVAQSPPSTPAAPASSPSAPASNPGSTGGSSGAGSYGMQVGASIAANCPKGTPCVGDMTTYTPGQGSCGYDDTTGEHADDAVALQIGMFGTVTNIGVNQPKNPLCNKKIQIVDKTTGQTAVGVIRDACPGCSHPSQPNGAGIDLAPALMSKLLGGAKADGRLPIEWYFLD